jgi:hypothetical protein
MIEIKITTEEDLFTLEAILTRVEKLSARRDIFLRLSRNLRWDFMRESRLAALLATLGKQHNLVVCDWYDQWKDDEIETHFRTSLVGIAAAFYSSEVTNVVGKRLPDDRKGLLERIALAGGLLEPKSTGSRGKSITFCAFDPDWPEPAALSGTLSRKILFQRTFEKYRRHYLEIGTALDHTTVTREADERLAGFIFELYQNTYEHSRRVGSDGTVLPGMRYVRLRKYIDRKTNFLNRAAGFEELTRYLDAVVPRDEEFKLYEIAVSDDGPGIRDHFVKTRIDLTPPTSHAEGISLINRLFTTSLTSKRDFPGAGRGLPNVLEAVSQLHGFISLRTNGVWLCGHSEEDEKALRDGLKNVGPDYEISPIVGTHFNILLPLRRGENGG